jgi:hypothetical protein
VSTLDLANYNLALAKDGVTWGVRRYDGFAESIPSGNIQTQLAGVPRWMMSLRAPQGVTEAEAVVWRALLLGLRGRVNYLKAWNPSQTTIRGTAAGTMTVDGSHAAGATTLNATVSGSGQVGNTILSGSPLTIGTGIGTSQLVHTITDATYTLSGGNSDIALTVEPPLRTAFVNATAITRTNAFAYFKQDGASTRWRHYGIQGASPSAHQEFALDLIEVWN